MLLSIVVPVYNEVHTLGAVLAMLGAVLPKVDKQIVVVDDYSKDGTREWRKARRRVHQRRCRRQSAIREWRGRLRHGAPIFH